MPAMTDPSDALTSFQEALNAGLVKLQSGEIDPAIFVHLDHPNGRPRFTYVRLQERIVVSLVMFVVVEPLDGIPCFHIGYAVPARFRGMGLAKSTIRAAVNELRTGIARAGIMAFYIEAIVGEDNPVSKSVAAATISTEPTAVIDEFSGLPAFQYLLKVEG